MKYSSWKQNDVSGNQIKISFNIFQAFLFLSSARLHNWLTYV